jgi:hypothetical protein
MPLFAPSHWWPRLAALVLGAVAAASAVAWWLQIQGPDTGELRASTVDMMPTPDSGSLAQALGARDTGNADTPANAAPTLEASRFVLLGVIGQPGTPGGAALLATDGKPAKPVVVGGPVADGWTLQTVASRSAVLARDGNTVTLELPALAPLQQFKAPPSDAAKPGDTLEQRNSP